MCTVHIRRRAVQLSKSISADPNSEALMVVSMPAPPSSPPIGDFAAGPKARKKKATPLPCPQKMDHDDPQKAGENVARAGCSGDLLPLC